VEAQILYSRAKLQVDGERSLEKANQMMFAFDGEYSTVTGQRDEGGELKFGAGDIERMRQEVFAVVQDLGCALRTKFKSSEAFAINTGGIIMRFTCPLELIAPLRPLHMSTRQNNPSPSSQDSEPTESKENKATSPVPLIKTFSGELEVAIVPDNSHRLFHGQRTIIRYRMLG
ncbi:hypothetical protein HYDPIDRAFT_84648, partial [Hydnomerulius pinastri MD-312]